MPRLLSKGVSFCMAFCEKDPSETFTTKFRSCLLKSSLRTSQATSLIHSPRPDFTDSTPQREASSRLFFQHHRLKLAAQVGGMGQGLKLPDPFGVRRWGSHEAWRGQADE